MRGLLALATGALQGMEDREAKKREAEERARAEERADRLFKLQEIASRLQLLSTPSVTTDPGGVEPFQPADVQMPGSLFEKGASAIGLQKPDPAASRTTGGMPSLAEMRERIARTEDGAGSAPDPLTAPPAIRPDAGLLARAAEAVRPERIGARQSVGTVGGQELYFDPAATPQAAAARKEAGTAARQREAWEALHDADPKLFPVYVEGFDYLGQMADFATDVRASRRAAAAEARTNAREDRREDRERRRQQAETRAVTMLQAGAPAQQVHAALETFPELQGELLFEDVQRLAKAVGSTRKPDARAKERRDAFEKRLGAPTTALQQDILDALAEGETPEEIVAGLTASGAAPKFVEDAKKYLRIQTAPTVPDR